MFEGLYEIIFGFIGIFLSVFLRKGSDHTDKVFKKPNYKFLFFGGWVLVFIGSIKLIISNMG